MKKILHCALFIALFSLPAFAAKDTPPLPLTIYERTLLEESALPVLVVSIKSLPNEAWTHGNPPRPVLKVIRIIRGGKFPWNMNALWQPMPYDASWAGADAQNVMDAWLATPMSAPPVDSEWIVLGEMKNNVFYVTPVARLAADKSSFTYIYKTLENKMPPANPVAHDPLIVEAARDARITPWAAEMAKADISTMVKSSAFVAEASIADMQPKGRVIQFTVVNPIKPTDSAVQTSTLKLMGLPDDLFSVLHDYRQSSEKKSTTFLIFMNIVELKDSDGNPVRAYAPANKTYAIQPATTEKLHTLGIKK